MSKMNLPVQQSHGVSLPCFAGVVWCGSTCQYISPHKTFSFVVESGLAVGATCHHV